MGKRRRKKQSCGHTAYQKATASYGVIASVALGKDIFPFFEKFLAPSANGIVTPVIRAGVAGATTFLFAVSTRVANYLFKNKCSLGPLVSPEEAGDRDIELENDPFKDGNLSSKNTSKKPFKPSCSQILIALGKKSAVTFVSATAAAAATVGLAQTMTSTTGSTDFVRAGSSDVVSGDVNEVIYRTVGCIAGFVTEAVANKIIDTVVDRCCPEPQTFRR